MKPRLEAQESEHCRFVAYVNGKPTSKVLVFLKSSDQSVPAATECMNLMKPKERARLVTLLPNEYHDEATHALLALSAKTVGESTRPETPNENTAAIDADKAYAAASALLTLPDIPKAAVKQLEKMGVAGEASQLELLYLVVTSRVLDTPLRPVSAIVKSISSAGKSFVVEQVLRLFPPRAFYAITAMSERALVYDTEPLKHRHLVIAETTGMEGDMQQLIIRSLLSEGRLVYPFVDKDENGTLVTRKAEREGPTGIILTTTKAAVHPENETRLLSLSVTETPDQTRDVFKATAKRVKESAQPMDSHELAPWQALQDWLSVAEHRVEIPYIDALAELIDNRAVRMRRDFTTVLALISARALLHQETRERNTDGQIVASFDDYAEVARLTGELVSYGIQAKVPEKVRCAVEAVADRCKENGVTHATSQDVGTALGRKEKPAAQKMEKSAVHKWVKRACAEGYLVNLETRPRQPAKLIPGEPMPVDGSALPSLEALEARSALLARSTVQGGTPSDDDTTASPSRSAFRADSGGANASLFEGASRNNDAEPLKTPRNGGTQAQDVDTATPNVPQIDPERERNAERKAASIDSDDQYAAAERSALKDF